ncbi:hypothetical protein K402DRAFT_463647 [Aulographum hederae CBS 113979]|uniref:Uncharacterized protein n=1 Tax=Aulographum hederae CBS 113979 TaxID=1176131 RepID=A0A6G1GZJ8_9PEZI|nr:hypothetical protein K402DRAFT_463647 [Aulographum hederae CBS 113979]
MATLSEPQSAYKAKRDAEMWARVPRATMISLFGPHTFDPPKRPPTPPPRPTIIMSPWGRVEDIIDDYESLRRAVYPALEPENLGEDGGGELKPKAGRKIAPLPKRRVAAASSRSAGGPEELAADVKEGSSFGGSLASSNATLNGYQTPATQASTSPALQPTTAAPSIPVPAPVTGKRRRASAEEDNTTEMPSKRKKEDEELTARFNGLGISTAEDGGKLDNHFNHSDARPTEEIGVRFDRLAISDPDSNNEGRN